VLFDGVTDLNPASTKPGSPKLGIGRKFQKPTVCSRARTIQDNLACWALNVDHRVRGTLFLAGETKPESERIERVAGDHSSQKTRATGWRGALSARPEANGWRSACCWRRIRKLLLVDEPVAGMTDVENPSDRRSCSRKSTRTRRSWSSNMT